MSINSAVVLFLLSTFVLVLFVWFFLIKKRPNDFKNNAFIGFVGLVVGAPVALVFGSALGNLILILVR